MCCDGRGQRLRWVHSQLHPAHLAEPGAARTAPPWGVQRRVSKVTLQPWAQNAGPGSPISLDLDLAGGLSGLQRSSSRPC